ncbi:MAG: flavodoxin domain-containing protein [Corynebacterium casei]|uniref:Flavodoxin domain-containing protein n=2 Tax=Corynebacterium casei TaxID=160386 RepID=G7HYQ5_9CORY|nr:flavodoxin domain-containing protein [Corynebacterium casei]AHI20477.1 hypothetical protein CCASEI_09600 [Corynebacterium casei LMG S-19264]MDN5706021.1 flavodoxin domain-containing protein [Corynebacterium casei]MDN5729643.1 flavodoxin domain-containing protein [Corynebacterium casei]MDN5799715.1 flavodoxin domain-containing protein [Corynebacterium casei]MDN5825784.1 flavodoxin domain-containing protein [Corynebacterium casei]
MVQVLYQSHYGSSKQYADAFAQLFDATASTWDDMRALRPELAAEQGPVVVFSYIHGPRVPGIEAAIAAWKAGRPAALCVVGMTLVEKARKDDALVNQVGEDITRFYLPGRLNYSELDTAHATVMKGIIQAVKLKPRSLRSENDQAMIDAYKHDIDRVDLAELDPVIAWAQDNA